MNKTQNIAIIDIGKTNIKIVLVNLNSFTELIVLSEPNVVANKGLYPHYDTDKLWKFIKSSLGTLYRRYSFCLLYTSPSPRDRQKSRMPSSA